MLRAIPGPVGLLVLMMLNPNSDDPYAVTEQAIVDVIAQMQTQISASTTSAATIALLPVANLKDGELVWITGRRRYFRWDAASTAAALSGEVIVPSTAPATGRWLSVPWTTSIENALQAAWTVDPVAGSDDNAAGPLATFMEYQRRVPVLYIGQAVSILSTLPDSDNLTYIPQVQWRQSLSGTFPALVITGTRTLGSNLVVASSANETGNAAPLIDAGAAIAIGSIIQATSGAVSGATAVVVALVAGTQFRTSPWQNASAVRVAPPAAADTIAVVSIPTINRFQICGENLGSLQVINLNVKALQTTGSASHNVIWDTCSFGLAQNIVMSTGCAQLFRGCSITTTGLLSNVTAGSSMQLRQCGVVRPATTDSFGGFSRVELSNVVWQSGLIDLGAAGTVGSGICGVSINSLGIFGVAGATVTLVVERGAVASIDGTLYGSDAGGGTTGTAVRTGGRVLVKSTTTPTLTGGTELIFDGAATANPAPPLATGVIPVAAALATWAAWVAAPFSRDVMSYRTAGTGINNYV